MCDNLGSWNSPKCGWKNWHFSKCETPKKNKDVDFWHFFQFLCGPGRESAGNSEPPNLENLVLKFSRVQKFWNMSGLRTRKTKIRAVEEFINHKCYTVGMLNFISDKILAGSYSCGSFHELCQQSLVKRDFAPRARPCWPGIQASHGVFGRSWRASYAARVDSPRGNWKACRPAVSAYFCTNFNSNKTIPQISFEWKLVGHQFNL